MKTELIVFEKPEDLMRPAAMLADGSVVAFPTETVYGLGANALDPEAVARIFRAKGRPADNPLIVHVSEKKDIFPLVREVSPLAECLIEAFMPGPITLVMNKSDRVPDIVSAGLSTVGIRIPSNPIARDLIRIAGVPVAAPSANESGSPSPTKASHVMKDMDGKIACVIDGGSCEVGLESTVVDVTGSEPIVLRPGAVTSEEIEKLCTDRGFIHARVRTKNEIDNFAAPRAPGMKYRHYAPGVPVRIVFAGSTGYTDAFSREISEYFAKDSAGTVGVFCGRETRKEIPGRFSEKERERFVFYDYGEDEDVTSASNRLFAGLRSLDKRGVRVIFAAGFSAGKIGTAYMNRLEKAAAADPVLFKHENRKESRTILFVCTGNTCRSPMAEAIFNTLAEQKGPFFDCSDSKVPIVPKAISAGIYADSGSAAATYAEDAIRELVGADLSEHRSSGTEETIVRGSRLILTMSEEHSACVKSLFPSEADRVFSIFEYAEQKGVRSPGSVGAAHRPGIPDPYGRNFEVYKQTAKMLFDLIEALFPAILRDMGLCS